MTADIKRPAPLMIRGVDMDLWQRVRQEALARGRAVTVGELLNEILRDWLERELGRLEAERVATKG